MKEMNMPRFNRAEFSGRLVKDPQLFTTKNNKQVAHFTVAVNESFKNAKGEYQEETSYIPVSIWNGFATKLLPHLKKGVAVFVSEGKLKSRSYETKDGKKHTELGVIGRRIQVLTRENKVVEQAAAEEIPHDVATHGV